MGHEDEEEVLDDAGRKRQLQELKRQVMRKVEGIQDPILLALILETIKDSEGDPMEGGKGAEISDTFEEDRNHPENRTREAPINRPRKSDADTWLESLGR